MSCRRFRGVIQSPPDIVNRSSPKDKHSAPARLANPVGPEDTSRTRGVVARFSSIPPSHPHTKRGGYARYNPSTSGIVACTRRDNSCEKCVVLAITSVYSTSRRKEARTHLFLSNGGAHAAHHLSHDLLHFRRQNAPRHPVRQPLPRVPPRVWRQRHPRQAHLHPAPAAASASAAAAAADSSVVLVAPCSSHNSSVALGCVSTAAACSTVRRSRDRRATRWTCGVSDCRSRLRL